MIQKFRDFPGVVFKYDKKGRWLCRPEGSSMYWSPVDIQTEFRLRVTTEPGFLERWIASLSRGELEAWALQAMNEASEYRQRCLDLEYQALQNSARQTFRVGPGWMNNAQIADEESTRRIREEIARIQAMDKK